MPASIEKTYADALFELITDECGEKSQTLTDVLGELESISGILDNAPELVKLMNTPTVAKSEKSKLLENIFKDKVSEYVYRFLCVLTDKGRLGYWSRIYRQYLTMYNQLFGITEIVVTVAMPLTEELREKIKAKMELVTGKIIKLVEKLDKNLIGGIIIDYNSTRLDGSIKTRLEALKQDIAGIIA